MVTNPMTVPNPLPDGWKIHHVFYPQVKLDQFWLTTDEKGPSSCCGKEAIVAYPLDPKCKHAVPLSDMFEGQKSNVDSEQRDDGGICACPLDPEAIDQSVFRMWMTLKGAPDAAAKILYMMAKSGDDSMEVTSEEGNVTKTVKVEVKRAPAFEGSKPSNDLPLQ